MITVSWVEQRSRALPEGGDSADMTFDMLELDIIEQDTYDVSSKPTTTIESTRSRATNVS